MIGGREKDNGGATNMLWAVSLISTISPRYKPKRVAKPTLRDHFCLQYLFMRYPRLLFMVPKIDRTSDE